MTPSQLAANLIRPYIIETPLLRAPWLEADTGCSVLLKWEHRQITGSFKRRGAANKLLSLSLEQRAAGIVTASTGNHAFGVSSMGQELGIPTEVFVSQSVNPAKAERIAGYGARVRMIDGAHLAAEESARAEAERSGRTYIPPYNDWQVVAGQGTIAVELLQQEPALDAVFVTTGGAGLIGGIGAHLQSAAPGAEVVGCWPENSRGLFESLQAGKIIPFPEEDTLSSSSAGNIEQGSITFPLAQRVIGLKVLVTEAEILSALRHLYREIGLIVEGAAGVALASFLKTSERYRGKTVVIVLCGGNVDPALAALVKQN
jgi:threonine dehydratase